MSNLLRAEWYKLFRNKAFWILSLIVIGLTFLLVLLPYLDYRGMLDETGVTVELHDKATAAYPLSGIKLFIESIHSPDLFLAVLLISILGVFFITNENANGTIKNLVSIGYQRQKIYLSKLIAFVSGSVALVLLFSISFGIFGSLFFEIGAWPDSELLINAGKFLLLSILFIIAFAAIAMFFSIMPRGTGVGLLLSVGFYLVAGAGLRMLSYNYQIAEKIQKYAVYYRYSTLADNDLSLANVFELTMIPFSTAVIFIVLGLIVFQRKDIS